MCMVEVEVSDQDEHLKTDLTPAEIEEELAQALQDLLDDAQPCDCSDNDKWCPAVRARAVLAKYKE